MMAEGEHVKFNKPESRRKTQMKDHQEVEEILGSIYNETPATGCNPSVISSNTEILDRLESITFPGRYITKVLKVRPFEVIKRFVRPNLSLSADTEPNADSALEKLYGISNLDNLLLLLTPSDDLSGKHIMHGYAIDGERHLGVTSLTTDEKDLIVYTQRPDNYNIIYCTMHLPLQDIFKKTDIRNRIFDVMQCRPTKPTKTIFAGNELTLYFRQWKPRKQPIELKKKKNCKVAKSPPPVPNEVLPKKEYLRRSRSASVTQSNVASKSSAINRLPVVDSTDIGHSMKPRHMSASRTRVIIKANTELELRKEKALGKSRINITLNPPVPNQTDKSNAMLKKGGKARTQLQMTGDNRNDRTGSVRRSHSELNTGRTRANTGFHTDSNSALPKHENDDPRFDQQFKRAMGKCDHKPKSSLPKYDNDDPRFDQQFQRAMGKCDQKPKASLPKYDNDDPRFDQQSNRAMGKCDHKPKASLPKYDNDDRRFDQQFKRAMGKYDHKPKASARSQSASPIVVRDNAFTGSRPAKRNDCSDRASTGNFCSMMNVGKTRSQSVGRSCSNSVVRKRRSEEIDNMEKDSSTESHSTSFSQNESRSLLNNRTYSNLMTNRQQQPMENTKNCNTKDAENSELQTLMKPRSDITLTRLSSNSTCRSVEKNGSIIIVEGPRDSVMLTDSESSQTIIGVPTNLKSDISLGSSELGFETPKATVSKDTLHDRPSDSPPGDAACSTPIFEFSRSYISSTALDGFDSLTSLRDLRMSLATSKLNDEDEQDDIDNQGELYPRGAVPPPTRMDIPLHDDGTGNGKLNAPKRRIFMTEIDKSKLAQRERQWVGVQNPNSKRRILINEEPKHPRIARHVVQKKPAVNYPVRVLFKPHQLHESDGEISIAPEESTIKFETSQTILTAKSSEFERILEPVRVPDNFSQRAHDHLKSKLKRMSAKQAFENLGKLVDKINARPVPQNRQLMRFFRMVELLEIQMFVRKEANWNATPSIVDARCRLECYIFDDRNEFILSVGLLCKQLNVFCELLPNIRDNIHVIDNALQLTALPKPLTDFLQRVMSALHAEKLFKMLAEMVYELVQPRATLLALGYTHPPHIKPYDKIASDSELKAVLEQEEALRKLKNKEAVALDSPHVTKQDN